MQRIPGKTGRLPARVDFSDYALDWPPELLCAELRLMRDNTLRPWNAGEVRRLVGQAFHGEQPGRHLRESDLDLWVSALLENQQKLRLYHRGQPYWRERQQPPIARSRRAGLDVLSELSALWTDLYDQGYFDRDTHRDCPYDEDCAPRNDLKTTLGGRVGTQDGVWPPFPRILEEPTFYELIEVLHDLAARPRQLWHHNEEDCPGHPHDHDTDSGQRIYRVLLNRLLERGGFQLRLADAGEDTGRLVHTVDDARNDLVNRALNTPRRSSGTGSRTPSPCSAAAAPPNTTTGPPSPRCTWSSRSAAPR